MKKIGLGNVKAILKKGLSFFIRFSSNVKSLCKSLYMYLKNLLIKIKDFIEKVCQMITGKMKCLNLIIAVVTLLIAYLAYAKVNVIQNKLQISQLSDRCMWFREDGGDYSSYEELREFLQNKQFSDFAQKQLVRVNNSFLFSYPKVEKIPICKSGKNIGNRCLEQEKKENFDIKNVVTHLEHPSFWTSRVKAAYLLNYLNSDMLKDYKAKDSKYNWEYVLNALYKAFSESDDKSLYNNLLTRYMAWESFRNHTCYAEKGVLLDVQSATDWWANQDHKQKVLNALKDGKKSPFCENK